MSKHLLALLCCGFAMAPLRPLLAAPRELRVGVAGHAFDRSDGVGEQAATAAASGANIIYTPGVGALGQRGLPPADEWARQRQATTDYIRRARSSGIELVFGCVNATSIAKPGGFDENWSPEFRARFRTSPTAWRQQDSEGKPLSSWRDDDEQPACMNNPDWRAYVRFIVRAQLEAGCDGIFFEEPTVHPQGCYCRSCMREFLQFLFREEKRPFQRSKLNILHLDVEPFPLAAARQLALTRTNDFRRFRCAIAREFLADLRAYARTIKPGALAAADSGENRADALYAECRSYARSIYEMSQAEDLVVVKGMSSQPRVSPEGQMVEFSPTCKLFNALSHGKPLVTAALVAGDYHAPPDLMRLALAEAAACDASYLTWPTWPEGERSRMSTAVWPQAQLLRQNEKLLNGARSRRDAALFLPYRQWAETERCGAATLADALTRANVQYDVICEDAFQTGLEVRFLTRTWRLGGSKTTAPGLQGTKVLVAESLSVFNPDELKFLEKFIATGGRVITADSADWLQEVQRATGVPPIVRDPPSVRAFVHDQSSRTIVHLLNLDVQAVSAFEDKVAPASNVRVVCRVPFKHIGSVRVLTADEGATRGELQFVARPTDGGTEVDATIPRLEIAALVVIEP